MKILKTMAELLVNEQILASVQSSGRFDSPNDYPALVVATGDTTVFRFRSGKEVNHQTRHFGSSCFFEVEVPTVDAPPAPTSTPARAEPETDDSLRRRLFYITASETRNLTATEARLASAIGNADGSALDDYALRYGLKRRGLC